MATISIADNDARVQHSIGSGGNTANSTTFTIDFPFFALDDINVIITNSSGVDTTLTRGSGANTFAVSGTAVDDGFSGGNVTLGSVYTSSTVTIFRDIPVTRTTDFATSGPFNIASLNTELDRIIAIEQELESSLARTLSLPDSDSLTEMILPNSSSRASKFLAFDANGNAIASSQGAWQGNWSAGRVYAKGDIVKDTSTGSIYIASSSHTSSGSEPLTSNADAAKWDQMIDASSATNAATSATNAATSATAAATEADDADKIVNTPFEVQYTLSNGNVGLSALHYYNVTLIQTQNAVTQAGLAQTARVAALAAQTAAEAALDLFDDAMLGAKASDPTVDNDGNALADGALYFDTTNDVMKVYNLATTSWLQLTPTVSNQTNINTVAGIQSEVTTVAGINSDVTTVAGINATHLSNVSGVATEVGRLGTADAVADMNTLGTAAIVTDMDTLADRATDIATLADIEDGTVATNAIQTVAANVSGVTSFAEVYRSGSTDPTTNLDEGDLFYNTTSDTLKVYNGSAWVAGVTAGSGFLPLTGGQLTGNLTFSATQTVDGRDVSADGTKLDGIEANATADQTGSEIKAAYEAEADTNAFTDAEKTKLTGIEASADVTDATNVASAGALMDSEVTNLAQVKAFDSSDYATAAQGTTADAALPRTGGAMTGAITTNSTFDGRDVGVDGTKLDGIEASADVTDATNVAAAGAALLSGATFTGAVVVDNQLDIEEVHEKVTVITSTSGTLTFDTSAQGVVFGTANQTANRTINFSNVNSTLAVGQSVTCAVMLTQGTTAYYLNTYQVDGSSVTPKWQGGTAPSAGNASGIDAYSFTIIKTANATFTVLASQTKFA